MDATDPQRNTPSNTPTGGALWGWLIFAGVAAAALLWVVISSQNGSARIEGPGIGQKLQYLRLQPLTGGARQVLLEDLDGQVTLLNYWGTWCPPCVREFPHLIELAEHFGDRDDFLFLPVSCGGGSDQQLDELRSATEAFLRARGVDLPVYADQNAESRRALAVLFAPEEFAYPTTVVLDRDGRIRGSWIGYSPRYVDEMRAIVAELLAEDA